jgi:hypothetical protein
MRIYVASSWRNEQQPGIVRALREAGHEVYDFRNPSPNDRGFAWSEIDERWQEWTPEAFRRGLDHPLAIEGFGRDREAMRRADACLLVLPCGRSAHLEAGFFAGVSGKRLVILLAPGQEPELMYRMADAVCVSLPEALEALRGLGSEARASGFSGSLCPQCGWDVGVDEDGCCTACGCVAVGAGAELALGCRAATSKPKLSEARARAVLREYPDADLSDLDIEGGRSADRLATEEADALLQAIDERAGKAVEP